MARRRAAAEKAKSSPNDFHRRSVAALQAANVPFLIGGAYIALILGRWARELDWPHLVRRFGLDWRVLLSHLILFGYIYPSERHRIPVAVMDDLITRLRNEASTPRPNRLCRGTLLSRKQYLVDIQEWGFRDARLEDRVHMN